MKRFLSLILALIVVLCCSGCGLSTFSSSENIQGSTFEPGAQLSVQGGGTVKFLKVHTARRLYPSLHFGSYLQCSSEEMSYIDIVFQLKNAKKALHSAELGGVSAIGNVSGIEYSDGICAVECNDNRDLLTNAQIEAGDTAVVHMAVEVPADTGDDEFEITVSVLSSTYSFLYEFGDKTDNMEYINPGQSISNQNFKAKLGSVYYSHELYQDAPAVCDSDDDYVYLISEFDVTNK
ncbi:MAG: hypothetical protein IJ365_00420, partial [Clostridia bacterium]|nr:hypothetical protein [Clostridia bacterium]